MQSEGSRLLKHAPSPPLGGEGWGETNVAFATGLRPGTAAGGLGHPSPLTGEGLGRRCALARYATSHPLSLHPSPARGEGKNNAAFATDALT
jgi:hypothetical protein